jgi:hypothetical protein
VDNDSTKKRTEVDFGSKKKLAYPTIHWTRLENGIMATGKEIRTYPFLNNANNQKEPQLIQIMTREEPFAAPINHIKTAWQHCVELLKRRNARTVVNLFSQMIYKYIIYPRSFMEYINLMQ